MSFHCELSTSIYVLVTLHLYYITKCKAGDAVYCISGDGPFKVSFDEAVKSLNIHTPNNFLRVNHNQGFNQWIETGLRLASTLNTTSKDDIFYFSDVSDLKSGIIKEIMEFQSRSIANRIRTIFIDNGFGTRSKVSIRAFLTCLLLGKVPSKPIAFPRSGRTNQRISQVVCIHAQNVLNERFILLKVDLASYKRIQ